ncbi:phosphatase PAP2 family protein [Bacteroides sp. 519]|uniref:phosphatase PAP2 family protein n=1 Tax=Bacteroides sp. 519 TaxID=2302937 RepID=UPI0013D7E8F8|nr:phosphatase PAP2 family protein [Bacteroides sp. 519]NDV57592.1 phosphatase PAP2 family protein [Bacteroides sp. 519]
MKKYFVLFFLLPFSCLYSQNWDINTLEKINSWDRGFVRSYSKIISKTTPYIAVGGPIALAVYAGISKNIPLLKDAVYIGSSVAEAAVLTYGIKFAADRKRPYDKYPEKIHPSSRESSSSFPSAHTASAFALATSLSIKYPKWYVIAPSAVWACSVGFARMNEGVHYPSDVIAGAIIGSGCAVANIYVNRWLEKWLLPKPRKAAANTVLSMY